MTSHDGRRRFVRVSLREMLLVVTFIAAASASLKHASESWSIVLLAGVLVCLMAAAIVAIVDRGRRRAMGFGFAVCTAIYGVVFCSTPRDPDQPEHRELDPQRGQLPTTKLLKPIFEWMIVRTWVDFKTGEEVPQYDPNADSGFGWGGSGSGVGVRETPPRRYFMVNGHSLWVLVLSYLGSRFAGWLYDRRRPQGTIH